jgi:uncharacterized protein (DUF58 family)
VDDSPNYLDPNTLARLNGLDLKARLIVEGFVSGLHRSPYHGFSVEFAEHREYVPGDDLRYVDWKVFGKNDRYYLKQFEEETNFACSLLLDTSQSMNYRSAGVAMSKLDYAKHVAAAIAYLTIQQQDASGLVTFADSVQDFVRPSSQPSHLRQLFHILEQATPGGDTSLGPVLHDLAERIRKRGLVIIFSDLFDDPATLMMGLKHFRHRRHDVSVVQVVDPAEQDFPFEEPTLFKGMEQPLESLTEPKSIAKAYRAEFAGFLSEVASGCRDLGMSYHLLRTDQPLDAAITAFLQARSRMGRKV